MKIVTALFSSHKDAAQAIEALKEKGIDQDTLSLISGADSESTYLRELIAEEPQKTAVEGALTGGVVGSLLGLLGGIFLIPLPGLGLVLASGALSSASGAFLGSFLGSLYSLRAESQPEIDIKEALAAGGLLLVVDVENHQPDNVEQILKSQEGEHVAQHEVDEKLI